MNSLNSVGSGIMNDKAIEGMTVETLSTEILLRISSYSKKVSAALSKFRSYLKEQNRKGFEIEQRQKELKDEFYGRNWHHIRLVY